MPRGIMYILLGSMCLLSCYEPINGCLDPDAKNYNVSADNDCSNCCQLPQADIVFTYLYSNNSFNFGDTLSLGNDQIILESFHIYLSNITLYDGAQNSIYLEDSVRISQNGNTFFVGDNFRFFDRQRFSTSLDGLRYTGEVSSISFEVGIPDSYNLYNSDSLRINSMLNTIPSGTYVNGQGFVFFSIGLKFIDGESQSLQLLNTYPLTPVSINLSGVSAERAVDLGLSFYYDIGQALDGISRNFTEEINVQIIRENMANSFGQIQ